MSRVSECREKHNLTQKELAEKSGLSIRTIQRIEAGTVPKGYTLRALLDALDVTEKELFGNEKDKQEYNKEVVKWINFSSLLFFIPLANILVPYILMKSKDQVNEITKQVVTLQILWTLCSIVVLGLSIFMIRWVGISRQWFLILLLMSTILNLFIIFRNAIELERNDRLYIKANFNII